MTRPLSIRWRLTLWYGAVLAAILISFSVAVHVLMRHHLMVLTDGSLGEELADFSGDVGRCRRLADFQSELGLRYASHEGYEFQVSDLAGRCLFLSNALGVRDLPPPGDLSGGTAPAFRSISLEGRGRWRMAWRVLDHASGPLVIQAAISLQARDRALESLLGVLLLAGPLALGGTLGGGYWLARKALAPVDRMVATAQEITATRLDRRLEAPNPHDELGRLVATFNAMISRLERSFDEVRRFTADAAHELRTPLAAMRTEAEVALRSPRVPDRDARVLEDLLEEIERLSRLVSQMLFLCREDAGVDPAEFRPIQLDELVHDAADHMQVVAREKGVSLEVVAAEPTTVRGDAVRLRQLVFNLLDNAVKYNTPGGEVIVRTEAQNGRAKVTITDTGIGIPPEHLPHLFERFYRVDPARGPETTGSGLGLSICRSIAEAHGGRVEITSTFGQGTTVTLGLPAAVAETAVEYEGAARV